MLRTDISSVFEDAHIHSTANPFESLENLIEPRYKKFLNFNIFRYFD